MKRIKYIIATGFGSGYFPIASGTFGSLAALILYLAFPFADYIWLLISGLTFILGTWASTAVEKDAGKDPGIVVIDEFVGQWLALLFLPRTLWFIIAAFLLFRILDILKPFPARRLENLKGGIGIMLDDVIAGIYVNLILQVVRNII